MKFHQATKQQKDTTIKPTKLNSPSNQYRGLKK
jgi:hypothetical protein